MLIIVIKSVIYIKLVIIKATISNASLTSNSLQKAMKLSTLLMLVVIINVIILLILDKKEFQKILYILCAYNIYTKNISRN